MRSRRLFAVLVVLIGSTFSLILIFTQGMAESRTMKETPLNAEGLVHEIFRAGSGELWISDYLAGEIWRVNPSAGTYTVYDNLTGASDGRLDSIGHLWWSDFDGGALGRYLPDADQATLWPLTVGSSPLGIAFDDSGQVWVTDVFQPHLYRFAPAVAQLCAYPLPDDGAADYILFHNKQLWLGDTILGRILRFNPGSDTFTIWQLPDGAYPQGMAFDGNGDLWWADPGLSALGRLKPQSNEVTIFAVPTSNEDPAEPEAVAVSSEGIWYTDYGGSVGLLDPAAASGDSGTLSPSTAPGSPTCEDAAEPTAVDVGQRSDELEWTDIEYGLAQDKDGWLIYSLPDGAAPWGVAVGGNNVWFTDQGTFGARAQQLGWIQDSGETPPTATPTTRPPQNGSTVLLPVVIGK